MTVEQVRRLHQNDEVHWTDPDNSACSRRLKILEIRVHEPDPPEPLVRDAEEDCVVWIRDMDGSKLECLASEL